MQPGFIAGFVLAIAFVGVVAFKIGQIVESAVHADERVNSAREIAGLRAALAGARSNAAIWERIAKTAFSPGFVVTDRTGSASSTDEPIEDPPSVRESDRRVVESRRTVPEEVIRRNPMADMTPKGILDPDAMPAPSMAVFDDDEG